MLLMFHIIVICSALNAAILAAYSAGGCLFLDGWVDGDATVHAILQITRDDYSHGTSAGLENPRATGRVSPPCEPPHSLFAGGASGGPSFPCV